MPLPNTILVSSQFGNRASVIELDADGNICTQLSYAELLAASSSLLNDEVANTLQKGDIAMVIMPSCAEFIAVVASLLHRGVVVFPLNPSLKLGQVASFVRQVEPAVVICKEGDSKLLQSVATNGTEVLECPKMLRKPVDHEDGLHRFMLRPVLDAEGRSSQDSQTHHNSSSSAPGPDDPAVLLFTSGTTGAPKGVALTHRNLLTSAEILSRAHRITKDDICMLVTPLYHVAGLCGSLLLTLVTGGTVVIPPPGPTHSGFWQHVLQYHVTWFHTVPTLLRTLVRFDGVKHFKAANGGCLRFVRCSASSLSQELLNDAEAAIGKPLLDVYGMTESSPGVFCNGIDGNTRVAGVFPIPSQLQTKIASIPMPSNGVADASAAIGELCIRGPSVITSYSYTDAESNAAAFDKDGFFRTGDLAQFVGDGLLKLCGRLKETINKGGVKINPFEVDAAILQFANVADVACFIAQDEEFGEDICELPKFFWKVPRFTDCCLGAAIVVEPNCDITTPKLQQAFRKELKRFLRQKLAGFQIPRDIHFVNNVPRTSLGKYNRRELTEKYGKLRKAL